ncbi:helix-turn-helix domain-containing protein [Nocardia callitridis]|uniref:Helix-turn-helix transcriptional regulator n=1 Tax=Nocardia callitridis TaxID=648753 RepID=A0ABP9JYF4_9NOCA
MPRRQLGRQLRDLRNRAKMTTRIAAERLEWSEAKIWRIETGQTSLRSFDVEAMCKIYGAPGDLVAPLTALAKETKARGWWSVYGDVIADGFEVYIGLEEAAQRLISYENELIPGLLQTEGYTRALLSAARQELSAHEIDRRVEFRKTRQTMLTRDEAPLRLDVVIGEEALARRIGSHEVHVEQLDHLLALSEVSTVRIRVVPTASGYHDGLHADRFVMLEFPQTGTDGKVEPPVVYLETFTGSVYLDKEAEIAKYRRAFEGIEAVAVDARQGIELARTRSA